jgi:hypothetical protein
LTDREVGSELHIVPEPTPDERQAIIRTLADEDGAPPAYRSAWRRSGLPSTTDDMSLDPGEDGRGEQTGGAAR